MKVLNKSQRGKQQFKFLSLRDRLRQQHGSTFQFRRKQLLATDDFVRGKHESELDTYLHRAILQCSDRDRTRSFQSFAKAVETWVSSLPLLLRNRKRVFRHWVRAFRVRESSTAAALAACLEAFAWDLEEEFYPFILPVIDLYVSSIDFGQATEVNVFFATFTRLFRFWCKHQSFAGHSCRVLRSWRSTLLCHRSEYVRLLAAQSAGILLRRLENEMLCAAVKEMISDTLDDAAWSSETLRIHADGVAALLFYGCMSARGQLHSAAPRILEQLHQCIFGENSETPSLRTYQQTLVIVTWWRLVRELHPKASASLIKSSLSPWMNKAQPRQMPVVYMVVGIWLERQRRSRHLGTDNDPENINEMMTELISSTAECRHGKSLAWLFCIYGNGIASAETNVSMRRFMQHLGDHVADARVTATVLAWLVAHSEYWRTPSAMQQVGQVMESTYYRLLSAGMPRAVLLSWICLVLQTVMKAGITVAAVLQQRLQKIPGIWQVADLENTDAAVREPAFQLARALRLHHSAAEEHRLRAVLLSDPSPQALAALCYQCPHDTQLLRNCLEQASRLKESSETDQALDVVYRLLTNLTPESKDAQSWAEQSELGRLQRKRVCSIEELSLCAKLAESCPAPHLATFFGSMGEVYRVASSFTNDIQQIDTARIHFRRAMVALRSTRASAVPESLWRLTLFTILGCLQLPLTLYWKEVPALWQAGLDLGSLANAVDQVLMPLLRTSRQRCDWAVHGANRAFVAQPLSSADVSNASESKSGVESPKRCEGMAMNVNDGKRVHTSSLERHSLSRDGANSDSCPQSAAVEGIPQEVPDADTLASIASCHDKREGNNRRMKCLDEASPASEAFDPQSTEDLNAVTSSAPAALNANELAPLRQPLMAGMPANNRDDRSSGSETQTNYIEQTALLQVDASFGTAAGAETTANQRNRQVPSPAPIPAQAKAVQGRAPRAQDSGMGPRHRTKPYGTAIAASRLVGRTRRAALSSASLWPWLCESRRTLRQIWDALGTPGCPDSDDDKAFGKGLDAYLEDFLQQPPFETAELLASEASSSPVREIVPAGSFYSNLIQLTAAMVSLLSRPQRMELVCFLLENPGPTSIQILHWNHLGTLLAEQALSKTDTVHRSPCMQLLWSALRSEHVALQRAALEALFEVPNWHKRYRQAYLPPLRVLLQSRMNSQQGKRNMTSAPASSLATLREQVAMLYGALVDLEAVLPEPMNHQDSVSDAAKSTDQAERLYALQTRYQQMIRSRGEAALLSGPPFPQVVESMFHENLQPARQRKKQLHERQAHPERSTHGVEAIVILPQDATLILPLVAALLYGRARALTRGLSAGAKNTERKRNRHLFRAIMQCYGQMKFQPAVFPSLIQWIQQEQREESRLLLATAMVDVVLAGLCAPARVSKSLAELSLDAFQTWYNPQSAANKAMRRLVAKLLERTLVMVANHRMNAPPAALSVADESSPWPLEDRGQTDAAADPHCCVGQWPGTQLRPTKSADDSQIPEIPPMAHHRSERDAALASPDWWLARLLPLIDTALASLSIGAQTSSAPAVFSPLQVLIQTDFYFEVLLQKRYEEAATRLWGRLADCLRQVVHPSLQQLLLSLLERFLALTYRCPWPPSLIEGLVRCLEHPRRYRDCIGHQPGRCRTADGQVQQSALHLLLQLTEALINRQCSTLPSLETRQSTEQHFIGGVADERLAFQEECWETKATWSCPAAADQTPDLNVVSVHTRQSCSLLLEALFMLIARKSTGEALRSLLLETFTRLFRSTVGQLTVVSSTNLLDRLFHLMERTDLFPIASRVRWGLSRSLQQLAHYLPPETGRGSVAALLEQMNRLSSTNIGQIDWDHVLGAYGHAFADRSLIEGSLLLLPHLNAVMQHQDGALRSAASDALVRLVLASLPAMPPDGADQGNDHGLDATANQQNCRMSTPERASTTEKQEIATAIALIRRVTLLLRKQVVQAPSLTLLRTAMTTYGRLVRTLPCGLETKWIDALVPLTNADDAQDVFQTIAHVQLVLRIRAVALLRDAPVSLAVQQELLLPLAERLLLIASSSGISPRYSGAKAPQHATWLASVCGLVTSLASRLAPVDCWARLALLIRRYDRYRRSGRVSEAAEASDTKMNPGHVTRKGSVHPQLLLAYARALPPIDLPKETRDSNQEDADKVRTVRGLQHSWVSAMFEQLEAHLYDPLGTASQLDASAANPAEQLNQPLFQTLIQMLVRMPSTVQGAWVSRLLTRLLRDLGLRTQRRRDDAREALQTLVRELGPDWLPLVCRQLVDTLPSERHSGGHMDGSFRAHVWPYTLQVLLQTAASLSDSQQTPSLDTSTLEKALWMALTEFRDPHIEAEKKVVKLYADVREAHVSSLWNSVTLLGQLWLQRPAALISAFDTLVRALRYRLSMDSIGERKAGIEVGAYRAASMPELESWRRLLHCFVLGITRQHLEPSTDGFVSVESTALCIRYLLEKPAADWDASTRKASLLHMAGQGISYKHEARSTSHFTSDGSEASWNQLDITRSTSHPTSDGSTVQSNAAIEQERLSSRPDISTIDSSGHGRGELPPQSTEPKDVSLPHKHSNIGVFPELERFRRDRHAEASLLREAALRWAWHWRLLRSSRPNQQTALGEAMIAQTTSWRCAQQKVWRLLVMPLVEVLESRHDRLVTLALALLQRLWRTPYLVADQVIGKHLRQLGPALEKLLQHQMAFGKATDPGERPLPLQPRPSLSPLPMASNNDMFATTLRALTTFASKVEINHTMGIRKHTYRMLWAAAEQALSRECSTARFSAGLEVFRLALRPATRGARDAAAVLSWSMLQPLVERIAQMVVQGHDTALQDQCIALLIRYCGNPRTIESERQRLVDLFVRNLEYAYESGRVASIRFLHRLITKMYLDGHHGDRSLTAGTEVFGDSSLAEYLLVPLAARLVNEQGAEAYQALRACLLALFEPLPAGDDGTAGAKQGMTPRFAKLQALLESWLLQSRRPAVRLAAALVSAFVPVANPSVLLALLLESIGPFTNAQSASSDGLDALPPRNANQVLGELEQPWTATAAQLSHEPVMQPAEAASDHPASTCAWHLAYAASRGLENALQLRNGAWARWTTEDAEKLLQVIAFGLPQTGRVSLLLHPHPWLRAALTRVAERLWHWFQSSPATGSLWTSEHASAIAATLCRQLCARQLSTDHALVIQRLVTQLALQLGVEAGPGWRWLLRRLSGIVSRARENLLARRVALSVLEQVIRQSSDASTSTQAERKENRSSAVTTGDGKCLDWSKAIEPFLPAWIFPLYRLERAGQEDVPGIDPELDACAERLRSELEQPHRLGAVHFWEMYQKITAPDRMERAARRAAHKRLAITDPSASAQQKRHRHGKRANPALYRSFSS
jgi:hypothetical protein